MKRLFAIAVLITTFTLGYGQKSIDTLFERYAGKDGFTTVTINGNLLSLFHCFDNDKDRDSDLPAGLTEIRILAQDDESMKVENFYDMVMKDINLSNYEEFMRVKDSEQNLRMLVRTEGKKFREFLLIAGGEDNAIIQIKGNLTFNDAKKISEDFRKNKDIDVFAEHK